jgi:hypothetical protein
MLPTKYIKFRNTFRHLEGDDFEDFCVVFPNLVVHRDVAESMRGYTAVSAGFVGMNANGEWYATGESTSLNIKADVEKDNVLLRRIQRGIE